AVYRSPESNPRVSSDELAHIRSDPPDPENIRVPWIRLLGFRQTWAVAAGKLLADPIWWFYLYWLPKFLDARYGIRLAQVALPLIVVYVVADVGSIGGGAFQRVTGRILQANGNDYTSIFFVCGLAYVAAWTIIHFLAPRLEPAATG